MADPDLSAFPLLSKGHAFEDFREGLVFEHHWGRTLNEGDNSLFATIALRFLPLYFNAEYARARSPGRGHRSAPRAVHRGRSLGGGPLRGGRPLPRRRGRRVPPPRPSRGHDHRPQPRRLAARVGEPPGVRHRHLGDGGSKPARRSRGQLPAHEPGREAGGVMDRRTGVLARVPEAYYSEERQAIVETARAFAMKEVLPVANRLDPVQGEMPMGLRDKMAELGYFGILIPQEYGGLGLGLFEYVLVTEELARAWMSVASLIARGNGIGAGFSEEKRREMLPKMARGECLGAFALSEPGAGSDVASIRCRAELVGDQWVVNGQKMWCTFADGADFIILVARATPYDPEHRHAGIAQFLIEKERGTFPPGIAGSPMRKVGYHGWKTWELSFDNFRIPKENILLHAARSGSSEGFKRTAMALSVARIHTAARSVGLARGAP